MAKPASEPSQSKSSASTLPFSTPSGQFYEDNRRAVRTHYRDLTKRFLDYNDPDNPGAYPAQAAV